MNTLLGYLKAFVAFVVPGASMLYMATFDDSLGHEAITSTELIRAVLVCILTAGGVAFTSNNLKRPRSQRGQVNVVLSGLIALLAVIALVLFILGYGFGIRFRVG